MKRIRPAPMGRAYRYQRRLTHIALSVAERESAAGLVTKVEEPSAAEVGSRAAKLKAALKAETKKTKTGAKAAANKKKS
jgi:large subunit ribosomal protein L22